MNTRTMSGAVVECDDVDTVNDIIAKEKCCNNCEFKVRLYDEREQKFEWNATVTNNEELRTLIKTFNDICIQKQD